MPGYMPGFTEVEERILNKYISGPQLSNSILNIRRVMESIWANDAPRIVQNYTDHGEEHSVRVAEFVEKLLQVNLDAKFSQQEIYLLLAGIYLHDIGMQCDVAKYPEIKEKAESLGAKFEEAFTAKTTNGYSLEEQKEIRKNHHFLSSAWIEYLYEKNDPVLSQGIKSIPYDLVDDLMDVCKFHSKLPINDCSDFFDGYPDSRKKMVASLLRFADELDISSTRVNIETVKIFCINPENSVYWWLHNYTKINFVGIRKVLLKVNLHPEDFKLYGSSVCEDYITNFRLKNQPVLNVLVEQDIPIVIDNNSDVVAHTRAEKFPPEITAVLDKKKKAFGIDDISKTVTSPSTGIEFVLIPAGKFTMGSPLGEQGRYDDEGPAHEVIIKSPFYMGKYPVTQKQWEKVMENNPSDFKGENRPVENVSWDNVQEFIKELNKKEGTDKYRLPSESEWEYAFRAGTTTRYSFRDDESKLGDYAWYSENAGSETHPVGQKKPNPWGLYDMHGNVWEWCQDKWHGNYDGTPSDGSAWESGSSSSRVNRGGGWYHRARYCRSAIRGKDVLVKRCADLGFRVLGEI